MYEQTINSTEALEALEDDFRRTQPLNGRTVLRTFIGEFIVFIREGSLNVWFIGYK